MKHGVRIDQLRADNNAHLNVIGDSGFVGVWTYPFDDGFQFVRLARSCDGHIALLAFGSEMAMDEFAEASIWKFVDLPEIEEE